MSRAKCVLHLHEEVLLLALRDEQGTPAAADTFRFALGGAILAEMLLQGRIRVRQGGAARDRAGVGAWLRSAFTEKNLVDLASEKRIGEPVLDECLLRIATAKRRASLKTWVQRFAGISGLHRRVAEGLCRRGVLKAEEGRILLIFKRKLYPEVDPMPERELVERLRAAIFSDAREVEPRTAIVVALADAAGLLKIPFGRKELRSRRGRVAEISSGQLLGMATREAVQAAQAAAATAAIVPCIVAASASS